VSSLSHSRRGGSLGRGLGRGGSELEPCLSRRCREEQMAGEGKRVRGGEEEGCGGRRMKNEEFRRPETLRRSPPPYLFPEEGADKWLPPHPQTHPPHRAPGSGRPQTLVRSRRPRAPLPRWRPWPRRLAGPRLRVPPTRGAGVNGSLDARTRGRWEAGPRLRANSGITNS
jgi:hypothetical protein